MKWQICSDNQTIIRLESECTNASIFVEQDKSIIAMVKTLDEVTIIQGFPPETDTMYIQQWCKKMINSTSKPVSGDGFLEI